MEQRKTERNNISSYRLFFTSTFGKVCEKFDETELFKYLYLVILVLYRLLLDFRLAQTRD